MATSYYGGGGHPGRTKGLFEVNYSEMAPDGARRKLTKKFTDYDQAEAFYSAVDDSAALWDTTGMPELCEAKSLIAYFSGTLLGKALPSGKQVKAVEAEDEEQATRMLAHEAKQSRLKLDPGSIKPISAEIYAQLQTGQ